MAHPMGERESGVQRLTFDRRVKLEFHGSKVTSDVGLLPFRELDEALGLTEIAGDRLVDPRTGKNGQHGWSVCSVNPPRAVRRLRGRQRRRPPRA